MRLARAEDRRGRTADVVVGLGWNLCVRGERLGEMVARWIREMVIVILLTRSRCGFCDLCG